jgi:hypothetical protein
MAGGGADAVANALLDAAPDAAVVEERDVLLPGEADHHPQPVRGRQVEEPPLGDGVEPHRVDAVLGHAREVARRGVRVVEVVMRTARAERPVRHPAHLELLAARDEELAAGAGRVERGRRLALVRPDGGRRRRVDP